MKATAPVLKAGHPVSYSFAVCSFVSWDRGFLGFFLLLSFCLLVYYISMHVSTLHTEPLFDFPLCIHSAAISLSVYMQ